MAGLTLTLRVVITPHTPESLADRMAEIINAHREHCGPEGIVPALLAEELVDVLDVRGEVIFLEDHDEDA